MTVAKPATTPMMAQYLKIKIGFPDALLFYRMGDFYEMFFDDAIAAAAALDIALTKRGKHLGEDVAMCGVPQHAAEGYLLKLIGKGFRVAVCEQMESPKEAKKRGYKAIVRREVVRLVTPGTLTEESLLNARRHNYLAAYSEVRADSALAWVDISTGEIHVTNCPRVRLSPELARLAPPEMLVSEVIAADLAALVSDFDTSLTPLAASTFDSDSAMDRLLSLYKVSSLDAFGNFSRAEISALGAILSYLELTQKGNIPLLRPPSIEVAAANMQIDAATRRNLELTQSLSGSKGGSLISTIDRTVTAGGGRLLEQRISNPSRSLSAIHGRLEAVRFLVENGNLRTGLRTILTKSPDISRALSRLGLARGGPRDLGTIRAGLKAAGSISALLEAHVLPNQLAKNTAALIGHEALSGLLIRAVVPEPPLLVRDGGFIASGFDDKLDELRRLRDEGRTVIAEMQAGYAVQTEISTLKIKHNNVLGYFIETTATHAKKMLSPPLSDSFIHRQTTASAVRFTTLDLSALETKILNAGAQSLEIEKVHFEDLRQTVTDAAGAISEVASALAEIDLSAGFAEIAQEANWCEPKVDESRAFVISGGRHPVVEAALRKNGSATFIANNCALLESGKNAAIWLLTGPNMAGKSTFLRQNALIALLAQAGSFVPARAAHIGTVSQLFSRVGASDDLARGRSTFMVEMVETAAILNQADRSALVILDEIGRGTATYDGLSIAWATLEHLHETNKCRALFATHYHELTQLADKLEGVENATITVKEWQGDVIFLHEVKKGAADRSYGIQVARLAGLPEAVVERARVVLQALEKSSRESDQKTLIDGLPLFAALPARSQPPSEPTELETRLKEVYPDELSPKDALDLVYQLKALLKKK